MVFFNAEINKEVIMAFEQSSSAVKKYIGGSIAVYIIICLALGFWWSREQDMFSVKENARLLLAEHDQPVVTGSVTTAALVTVAKTLLEKQGGFLSNDIFPPGVLLDNIPNWEYGALIQVRDLARAMRETISRSQSQSQEDKDLAIAEPQFNFSHESWAIPASEDQYLKGIVAVERYLQRLSDADASDAQFYARADNLNLWLGSVQSRLGSLSLRLGASVGQRRVNTDLAGDSAATQSTQKSDELEVKTDWTEIDDVFYETKGAAWALLHFLKAVEVDFEDILKKKNALVSLRQIIRELEATQDPVMSPVILNGHGFGFLANHSLVMASYISRANAAIIELRELLAQG